MKSKLFLLCPDSKLEGILRRKYKNAFFLTALAAVFKLEDEDYVEQLIGFIERASIKEVVVVNDEGCRFIESVLLKQKGYGTYAETVLVDLLLDHYAEIVEGSSVAMQKKRLAVLNVQRQIQMLLGNVYFLQQVVLQRLKVKGLVTCRTAGRITAMQLHKAEFSL